MRKFAEFEESDSSFGEYLESIEKDDAFVMRLHFPRQSKVDTHPLEGSSSNSASETGAISIEDCLERFRIEELLKDDNKYYCRSCKEHQETFKKMDIYRLPKILVVQLKRFSKGGGSSKYGGIGRMMTGSSKNSDLIDFPIEGLDMGKYLIEKEAGKEYLYDLYAVSNHMGSLYGGHYTAHCKNSITNKWYYFNDSSVGGTSRESIVCSSAYVLFYRLRE
jgi:ubiquitin carboxyl-terminal hydrolase 4/11/15